MATILDDVEDITPRIQYIASAGQTSFDYPFPIFEDEDIVVDVDGVIKALGTDYSVSGEGNDTGGSVLFVVGRTVNSIVTIYRDIPIERTTDFQQNGPWSSDAINEELDRITLVQQQLEAEIGRTIRFPITGQATSASLELTPISNWFGKFLAISSTGLLTAADVVSSVVALTWDVIGGLINPVTSAESACGFGTSTLNLRYTAGDVRRFKAVCDNVTDDTAAINNAATVARYTNAHDSIDGEGRVIFKRGTCKVSSTLDFSGIDVQGYGEQRHIQATSAQFDVMKTTGSTKLYNLVVDGGWNGSSTGQTGDILAIAATAPAFPYIIQISNCTFIQAKRYSIFGKRMGYTSLHATRCLGAGLDAFYIQGTDLGANSSTTVGMTGHCQFGGTPNGYGLRIEYGVNINVGNSIIESTHGPIFIGGDNRDLSFIGTYAETSANGLFFDWSTSTGIGMFIAGCVGGNMVIPYNDNWQNVGYGQNSNLGEAAVPLPGRVVTADSGQLTTSTTGGVELTAVTATIPPGTWLIHGTLQTLTSTASGMSQAACALTATVTDSGLQNGTSTFAEGAAQQNYNPGTTMDQRLSCFTIYQNKTTSSVSFYLRARLTFSGAGALAYHGRITAIKMS